MDPMSALAVAALVIQVVDIGVRLVRKGAATYKNAKDNSEKARNDKANLQKLQAELTALRANLHLSRHDAASGFVRAIEECDALVLAIGELLPGNDGAAASSLTHGKERQPPVLNSEKVESLEKRMQSLRELVIYAIVMGIWYVCCLPCS